MIKNIKQYISIGLLFVLAWSCFGLSLGMIGHGMIHSDTMQIHAEGTNMHDCCALTGSAAEGTQFEHHGTLLAAFVHFQIILLVVASIVLIQIVEYATLQVHTILQLYFRRWKENWSYYALCLVRLFSKGLLHPKTW